MEVAAKLRAARISAQKARLVADQVRGKPVEEALTVLEFSNKKAAVMVRKVLNSALPMQRTMKAQMLMSCACRPSMSTKVSP